MTVIAALEQTAEEEPHRLARLVADVVAVTDFGLLVEPIAAFGTEILRLLRGGALWYDVDVGSLRGSEQIACGSDDAVVPVLGGDDLGERGASAPVVAGGVPKTRCSSILT